MTASRILVAVSSPWASERLVAPVADMAQRLGSTVIVAHIAQSREDDQEESDARQRGEATLKLLTDALREGGVDAEGILVFSDDVPKAILNTAKEHACTLILLGMAGDGATKGFLRRFFSPDVPASVARGADLPVLLCPTDWRGMI